MESSNRCLYLQVLCVLLDFYVLLCNVEMVAMGGLEPPTPAL
jgi:hypothetical protein